MGTCEILTILFCIYNYKHASFFFWKVDLLLCNVAVLNPTCPLLSLIGQKVMEMQSGAPDSMLECASMNILPHKLQFKYTIVTVIFTIYDIIDNTVIFKYSPV